MLTFTSELSDELIKQGLDLKDTRDWKIKIARKKTKEIEWKEYIRPYSYRPFDNRYICYLPSLIDRDRWDMMKNFFEENLGLVLRRSAENTPDWRQIFVGEHVMDINFLTAQTYIFPLYLYQTKDNPKKRSSGSIMMLFEPEADYLAKKPNISPAIVEQLTKDFRKTSSPEQIFFYIYAVLYSSTYRTKYAEFLKIDFPRIPFTKDYNLFIKMAEYGKRLVDLHLLKSTEIAPPVAKFQGKGDNKIEKVKYENGRLYINQNQYFEGITNDIWEYQIGGYQVCDKWLKDRKGRRLSLDDIKHYCRIVTALQNTIKIQKALDNIYMKIESTSV